MKDNFKKNLNVDDIINIIYKAGGNLKGFSLFAKKSEGFYRSRLRDYRKLTIGDIYLCEQYIDKTFGNGVFQATYEKITEENHLLTKTGANKNG